MRVEAYKRWEKRECAAEFPRCQSQFGTSIEWTGTGAWKSGSKRGVYGRREKRGRVGGFPRCQSQFGISIEWTGTGAWKSGSKRESLWEAGEERAGRGIPKVTKPIWYINRVEEDTGTETRE